MKRKKISLCVLSVLITVVTLVYIAIPQISNSVNGISIEGKERNTSSSMKVHFLDVGQADSIIIESNKHFMVVDAGNNGDGDMVVDYLRELGATTIDYVIGTHPHEDHIGGLDDVLENFNVKTVILPKKESTTDTFADVVDAIVSKKISITAPVAGMKYSFGEGSFIIIAPNKNYKDELNNWSVGIKLTNGKNSFVMCGDGELEAEYDICNNGIDIRADVLKVGHHGSDTATSQGMLKAINPQYAVISVGIDNQYGHPHGKTLNRLKQSKIKYFRTDEQGTIIATSNGTDITWNCKIETKTIAIIFQKEYNIYAKDNGVTSNLIVYNMCILHLLVCIFYYPEACLKLLQISIKEGD